ncbi:MAG: hypothetical protein E5V56_01200 [Mesorhizobium sp.]|nr:MAG: hypothetical protein E5V56_01200 [Mesorhizobium sp.]
MRSRHWSRQKDAPASTSLQPGLRVIRKKGVENGTVVEANPCQIDRGAPASSTYISSDDRHMLTQALTKHCHDYGISADAERNDVARLMMVLFVRGIVNAADMEAALAASRRLVH